MNALTQVCHEFEKISLTSSRNEKKALLARLRDDHACGPIAREMLSIAMDWYRMFGVRQLPVWQGRVFDDILGKEWENYLLLIAALENGERFEPAHISAQLACSGDAVVQKWLSRCLVKDLQLGAAESTINEVWPGLIKMWAAMKPYDVTWADLRFPLIEEHKLDGVRMEALFHKDKPTDFRSYAGKEFRPENLKYVEEEVRAAMARTGISEIMLDGEVMVAGRSLHYINGLLHRHQLTDAEKRSFHFNVFDWMTVQQWEQQSCPLTQIQRHKGRSLALSGSASWLDYVIVNNLEEAQKLHEYNTVQLGLEGTMFKVMDAPYVWDRHLNWMRIKTTITLDLLCVGFNEGTNKLVGTCGSLTIQLPNGGTCNVNMKDEAGRNDAWANRDKYLNRYAEIMAKCFTPDGSLREPRFKRWRLDK